MQETKLAGGIKMRQSLGYKVWAMEAESRHGGGGIVWRDEEVWGVVGVQNFGPNMVSFKVTSGRKLWYVVGAYVLLNNLPALHWITHVLACVPEGVVMLIVGDLNA